MLKTLNDGSSEWISSSDIKWIDGRTLNLLYDVPEGCSRYSTCLGDDLYCYKHDPKEWDEVKKVIPKELHRRRWIPSVITFIGDKQNKNMVMRVLDKVHENKLISLYQTGEYVGDYVPIRTLKYLINYDSNMKFLKRQSPH